jgi:WD40 repeat protein
MPFAHFRLRPHLFFLVALLASAVVVPWSGRHAAWADGIEIATIDHPEPVDFAKEIAPILRKKCLACHNATDAESDLVLESPEAMIKGGFEGPALVPGKPDESLLFLLAAHQQEPIMPPADNSADALPLTSQELALLQLWIQQGAQGTSGDASDQIAWQAIADTINPVYAAAQSPAGELLAVGRARQIWLYDLPRGQAIAQLNDPSLADQPFAAGQPLAHLDLVQSIAFGPDGKWIASGGYRTVKLWKQQAAATDSRPFAAAPLVQYRWRDAILDGVSESGTLTRAAADGQLQTIPLENCRVPILAAAWLADGTRLVTAEQDHQLAVYDLDGKQIAKQDAGGRVSQLIAVSATQVVGLVSDGVLRVWSWQDSNSFDDGRDVTVEGNSVVQLAAWNDQHVLTADQDGVVRLCELASSKTTQQVAHGGNLKTLVGHAASQRLVTVGDNGLAKLWQLDQAKHLADLALHKDRDHHAKQRLLAAQIAKRHAENAKADLEAAQKRVTDEEENLKKTKEALVKAQEEFDAADKALLEANTQLATAQTDVDTAKELVAAKEAEVADAAEGEPRQAAEAALNEARERLKTAEEQLKPKQEAADKAKGPRDEKSQTLESAKRSVDTSTDTLATSQAEAKELEPQLSAADAAQQTAQAASDAAEKQRAEHAYQTHSAHFNSDGSSVVTIDVEGTIARWNATSGQLQSNIPVDQPLAAGMLPINDQTVIVISAAGDQQQVHLEPQWELARTIGAPDSSSPLVDRVTALAFSPDGQMVAVGGGEPSRNGELKLFRVDDGTLVREFTDAHSDTIFTVAFSHDGKSLASGAADRFMKAFEVETGKLLRTFEGHTHHVLSVSWRADGRVLASGGADQVVKLWNVQDSSQIRTIQGFGKEVTGVNFAGSSDALYATCGDQNIYRCDMGGDRKSVGRGDDFLYVVTLNLMGNQIAFGGHDSIVRVIDDQGKPVAELK